MPLAWKRDYVRPADPQLIPQDDRTIINPETGALVIVGETWAARTIYTLVSSACLLLLALLLGYRARQLKYNAILKAKFTSMLVLFLYVFAILFVFGASTVQSGLGLASQKICYSAAITCLVFYTGNKLTIYIFLLERARVVRAPFVPRLKDWLWTSGMIVIVGGFGTIAVFGYMSPIVELSQLDGRCRIGLPSKISFPLLSFDVGVNFMLTGVFFFLLRPVLSTSGDSSIKRALKELFRRNSARNHNQNERDSHISAINRNIKTLLWKSLIGSAIIMLPTVGNMAQFYLMKGRELGWICLTVCTLDITWGVIVVHWLTIGSAKAEENLTRSVKTLREMDANSADPLTKDEDEPREPNDLHEGLLRSPPRTYSREDEGAKSGFRTSRPAELV
ncbi:hypothetical protein B0J11DRAFT_439888 [Dendryphion nanum]|uniref:Uncharacterized protein n=1 Tax=Dendryphion nanum TaxID=256645 RepID=A0A9P9DI88_9PLEO|nr:hypothetical protein B0J11DRAFT_439888 [Dendryphion nanum]